MLEENKFQLALHILVFVCILFCCFFLFEHTCYINVFLGNMDKTLTTAKMHLLKPPAKVWDAFDRIYFVPANASQRVSNIEITFKYVIKAAVGNLFKNNFVIC